MAEIKGLRVLAIDPGYDRLGIALIEGEGVKGTLVHSECFVTSRADIFENRLLSIGQRIETLIQKYAPTHMALETLFLSTNQKTAMRVSEVRGALIYIAARSRLTVREFTPLQTKIAILGYGKGEKRQIQEMLPKLIKMGSKKALDDEYDAIAIGLTTLVSEASRRLL